MRDGIWVFFGLIFAGQMCWLISSEMAQKWLRENDPTFEPPGIAAKLFIGRLFTAFGPMTRYSELRSERGEPAGLVTIFWSGVAVSMLGLVGVLVLIAKL